MAALGASTTIIVTGGDPLHLSRAVGLPADAYVVAADSGIEHAQALGLVVDLAVGDFDSVAPDALQRAIDAGAAVERHPADKDASDLQLALDAALAGGAHQVLVLGGHGGRLDHFLANVLLLASPKYAALELTAQVGDALVTVIRQNADLHGAVGDLVTLLAAHGDATGVRTEGLRYALDGEDLLAGSTRGLSNVLTAPIAHVHLAGGVLLAVQPTLPDPHERNHQR